MSPRYMRKVNQNLPPNFFLIFVINQFFEGTLQVDKIEGFHFLQHNISTISLYHLNQIPPNYPNKHSLKSVHITIITRIQQISLNEHKNFPSCERWNLQTHFIIVERAQAAGNVAFLFISLALFSSRRMSPLRHICFRFANRVHSR